MNVLKQLTTRNLKLNRKRTIVTIIGIILSGAMICGVSTLIASFQDMFIRSAHLTDGSHHAVFYDVSYENSKYISAHVYTKEAMLSKDEGVGKFEQSENEFRPYWLIKNYDAKAFEHMPVELKEGRFPEKNGEIVISEEVFYDGGAAYQIGDTFTVEVGQRVDDGKFLDQITPLTETETLENVTEKTYTITGIIKRPRFEFHKAPGYTAIAYLDEEKLSAGDHVNVSIVAKTPKKIFEQAPEMAEAAGISSDSISYNNELLRWLGATENNALKQMFQTIGLIIILLIVVGSVTVIYNAFAISVSERKKQFGMLSSVGATGKQIRNMVFLEGVFLGLIGIPIGILSGIAGIAVTLQVVNHLMADSFFGSGLAMNLVISTDTILISIFFIALTILLSAFIPAKRASLISPVDAIRLTTDINIKGNKLRTSKWTRRLFGIEGELALKNLKRNRKRYRATVFSLFISIVLYVSFSSFMTYGFNSSDMYYNDVDFDMVVEKQGITPEEKEHFYLQAAALDAVENYSIQRNVFLTVKNIERAQFGSYIQKNVLDSENENMNGYFQSPDGNGYEMNIRILTVGEKAFSDYVSQLGLNKEDYENPNEPKGILINWNMIDYPVQAEYEPLNIEAGEMFTVYDYPYEEGNVPYSFEIEAGAVTDQFPFAVSPTGLNSVTMIVSSKLFEAILPEMHEQTQDNSKYMDLYLKIKEGTDRIAFADQIKALDAQLHPGHYLYVYDAEQAKKDTNRTKTVMAIFLYGFVSLITLIGVTNIFNTISTNVALRRREFAMLKSVGLTPAGFNKMMNYESIFYGLKSLLYGLPVSILISMWMYRSINQVFQFSFALPWKEITVCTIGVFIIVFITMLHSSSKLKKENIIDALKDENL